MAGNARMMRLKLRFLSERSEMKKRFYTIPAGPFLSPDVFPQCVGIFGDFKMINILAYVSKRRSEASVSFFLKSLEMDHFRCSVAPQIPMFSLYCIFSISIGALHVIGYKNIHAFGCAATAATNPRVTIRIDGKSDAGAQTRTRRAARARAASLQLRPSRKLSRASSASGSCVAFDLSPLRLLFWLPSRLCSQSSSLATFGRPVRSSASGGCIVGSLPPPTTAYPPTALT